MFPRIEIFNNFQYILNNETFLNCLINKNNFSDYSPAHNYYNGQCKQNWESVSEHILDTAERE